MSRVTGSHSSLLPECELGEWDAGWLITTCVVGGKALICGAGYHDRWLPLRGVQFLKAACRVLHLRCHQPHIPGAVMVVDGLAQSIKTRRFGSGLWLAVTCTGA